MRADSVILHEPCRDPSIAEIFITGAFCAGPRVPLSMLSRNAGLICTSPPPAGQAFSGVLLLGCTLLALRRANSSWAPQYHAQWHLPLGSTTPKHVVNDGLMALFFLMVGLEIKYEILDGALSSMQQPMLPVVVAIGAVLVIALLYTCAAHAAALGVTAVVLTAWLRMNRMRVNSLWPYLVSGLLRWYAVYLSGIHASIAGVLLAATIPVRGAQRVQHRLERGCTGPSRFSSSRSSPWPTPASRSPITSPRSQGSPPSGPRLSDSASANHPALQVRPVWPFAPAGPNSPRAPTGRACAAWPLWAPLNSELMASSCRTHGDRPDLGTVADFFHAPPPPATFPRKGKALRA